jgi:hypothetical protein
MIRRIPEPRYEHEGTMDKDDALQLVLMFYGPLTNDNKAAWLRITGTHDINTRTMCDHIRKVLKIEPVPFEPQLRAEEMNKEQLEQKE